MFKGTELKTGLTYIMFGPILNGEERTIKEDGAYDKEGKICQPVRGNNIIYTDDFFKFTLKYPSSIKEAAKILDAHFPGWATKINLDVYSQRNGRNCILGQLYSTYFEGMKYLFDFKMQYIYSKKINLDKVFGTNAPSEIWKEEINLRLNTKKETTMNWLEALKALADGKKVQGVLWDKKQYWYKNYLNICWGYDGSNVTVPDILSFTEAKFKIYEPVKTFVDLKAGDKFTLNGSQYIKAKKDGYAINASDYLEVISVSEKEVVG